jgi:hypothetical protein
MTLGRAAAAEAIGTALLLAIVVGSGIMGERLAQGNMAVALLANSIATAGGLYALIVIFGPVFWSAPQSRSIRGEHLGATPYRAAGAGLHAGANLWSLPWCRHSSRDVWFANCSGFSAYSPHTGRGSWRSRRHLRPRPDSFSGI